MLKKASLVDPKSDALWAEAVRGIEERSGTPAQDKVSPALNLMSHRGEVRRGNQAKNDAIRMERL